MMTDERLAEIESHATKHKANRFHPAELILELTDEIKSLRSQLSATKLNRDSLRREIEILVERRVSIPTRS